MGWIPREKKKEKRNETHELCAHPDENVFIIQMMIYDAVVGMDRCGACALCIFFSLLLSFFHLVLKDLVGPFMQMHNIHAQNNNNKGKIPKYQMYFHSITPH